mmetsp:Transcript_34440/g.48072  ORF Transcript_34440/g.48072 Transcript_34440/m.48072 type:complete len:397 (+) Transcript_34440:39-1229(+)
MEMKSTANRMLSCVAGSCSRDDLVLHGRLEEHALAIPQAHRHEVPVHLLKNPSLHDVEQCVGLRLVQGHKGRHGIHSVSIELRQHQLVSANQHRAGGIPIISRCRVLRLAVQHGQDVVHDHGCLRGNRAVSLGCGKGRTVTQGEDVGELRVLACLLVNINEPDAVGQRAVLDEVWRAHGWGHMQKVELLLHPLATLFLEDGHLARPVHFYKVGLHVRGDALLRHDLLQGCTVRRAGEDPGRRGAEVDLDLFPHTLLTPSAVCQVGNLLWRSATVDSSARVGKDGLALLRCFDVFPDLRGELVGIDRGHAILADCVHQTRHKAEILLEPGSHDQDVVLELATTFQGDAVAVRLEGRTALLYPGDARGNDLAHGKHRLLFVQAQSSDHRPVRLVEVLV